MSPKTVNINLNTLEARVPVTPPRRLHRVSALRREGHGLRRSVARTKPYSRPSQGPPDSPPPPSMAKRTTLDGDEEIPQTPRTTRTNDEEVPETPQGQDELLR